jgi:hypothetical protein
MNRTWRCQFKRCHKVLNLRSHWFCWCCGNYRGVELSSDDTDK